MKIIVLFVILLLVPLLIGRLVADIIKKEYCMKSGFWYLSGFLTMLALYQIICVPMTLKEYSFSKLVICYSIILGILSAIALWKYAGAILIWVKEKMQWINIFRGHSFFFYMALALILGQIITLVCFMPDYAYCADDNTYITMANDTDETDMIIKVDSLTGHELSIDEVSLKYKLTSFITFMAYLARISGLHSLVIGKTILPVIIIGMAYYVQWMIGGMLFPDSRYKSEIFLFVISIVNLFMAFSNYTQTFRLMVCPWQGKAIMAVIVLPFLFYVGNKVFCEKFTIGEMILLMITMFAAASASLMSLGIAPVMLLVIAFLNAIQKHRFMILLQAGICCVPAAIYLGMYVISILTTFGGW